MHDLRQRELYEFKTAYTEALLSDPRKNDKTPLYRYFTVASIAREAKEKILEDCQKFIDENEFLIPCYQMKMAGHDFCFSRNRHEWIGFDHRGSYWGRSGLKLAEAARAYGEFHLCPGTDGKLHVMQQNEIQPYPPTGVRLQERNLG